MERRDLFKGLLGAVVGLVLAPKLPTLPAVPAPVPSPSNLYPAARHYYGAFDHVYDSSRHILYCGGGDGWDDSPVMAYHADTARWTVVKTSGQR